MQHSRPFPRRWSRHGADLAIVLLALVLRLAFLDAKPAHFDEGVNGWFVDKMTREGFFQYDPTNYHGPLHFYAMFASQTLLGRNLWALRLPVVAVGMATVAALLALRRFTGTGASRLAALAFAVSPAFVFHNRYAIHESWLVLFLVTLLYGVWGMMRHNGTRDLWIVCMSATGMVMTKETYAIHLVALALAWPTLRGFERLSPSTPSHPTPHRRWDAGDAAACSATCILTLAFFYSGNFLHWQGLAGPFTTFTAWVETGTASSGHEKPPLYWLSLMASQEWPALLGLASCIALLPPAPAKIRLLAIWGAGSLLAYSLIPYKTPWCLIALAWPFLIVAGWLATHPPKWTPRLLPASLLALAIAHSLWQALSLNFHRYTDDTHPYVYVQTHKEAERLLHPILTHAKSHPEGRFVQGAIHLSSQYPLPWYFGEFPFLAYHDTDSKTPAPLPRTPDFLVVPESWRDRARETLQGDYAEVNFRLRSGQESCTAFFHRGVYGKYLDSTPNP